MNKRPAPGVESLPGVSPARAEALGRLGILTVEDLLRLAPRRHEDRRAPTPSTALVPGGPQLFIGRVLASRAARLKGRLGMLEARLGDAHGSVVARWFYRGFVPRPLGLGRRLAVYGAVRARRGGALEFSAPEIEALPEEDAQGAESVPGVGRLVPVHPLTRGLTAPWLRRLVWAALAQADAIPDPLPEALRRAVGQPALGAALRALHFPDDAAAAERARERLAFDELLGHELALAVVRRRRRAQPGWPVPFPRRVDERIRARLPFRLTPGQEAAVAAIVADLASGQPMHRLLQGDVGSGKTLVAVYAMLGAVAAGLQVAFMVPTEVLARQHAQTLARLLERSRVRTCVLAGADSPARRAAAHEAIARGDVDLVVGTHAVISEAVRFARLGLVIVDEQHKFGVEQRRDLRLKGAYGARRPHCLVMSATPIPRTLAFAVYGDLDVSVIPDRPPGRRPVQTWVARPADGPAVLRRVRAALAEGQQAFVVYPVVREREALGLRDAEQGVARWRRALRGLAVDWVHGQMPRAQKEHAMDEFRAGRTRLLVATVVVEVGVDVPNATVLVVEHAERFGLSQLHQLRGRVGRGSQGGLCVLVDRSRDGGAERLAVLARTDDGFEIAEEDLRLRGLGDLFGTRQHGRPHFVAARLPRDLSLLERARAVAARLEARDPDLARPAHAGLARLRGRFLARAQPPARSRSPAPGAE